VLLHGLAVAHRYLMPVAAWLQATRLLPVVVLGNSFGCQVAVDLAVRHPDGVCGLVRVGPTVDPVARTAFQQILRWLRDTLREDPLRLPILLRDVRDAGLRRVAGTPGPCGTRPIEHKLPLVTVPTLATRGAKEPIVPMAWAVAASRLLPRGELAVVPTGHTTPTTAPPTIWRSWCWRSCAEKRRPAATGTGNSARRA
jgi:pimeloyl-ACP methyl ester carboxylesterase